MKNILQRSTGGVWKGATRAFVNIVAIRIGGRRAISRKKKFFFSYEKEKVSVSEEPHSTTQKTIDHTPQPFNANYNANFLG